MCLTLLFAVFLWRWSRWFYLRFPGGYVWTELMINYQGGFMRRGLIGDIAYRLHPYVPTDLLLSVVFGVLNLIVVVGVVFLVFRTFDWFGLAYLLAPTGIAFPLYDVAAFNRRDILFAAGFLLCAAVVSKLQRPWLAFLIVSMVYAVLGTTQEVAWFYFPFALALLLQTSGRELPRRDVVLMGLLTLVQMTAGLAVMFAFKGSPEQAAAVVTSWQAIVPDAFTQLGGAHFIGQQPHEILAFVKENLLRPATLQGFALGTALTAIPVILYARKAIPKLQRDALRVLALVLAVASVLLPLPLSLDAGRIIYLLFLHIFITAAVLRGSEDGGPYGASALRMAVMVLLVLIYASTWQLKHAAQGGENPLKPGPLLQAILQSPIDV